MAVDNLYDLFDGSVVAAAVVAVFHEGYACVVTIEILFEILFSKVSLIFANI